MRRSKLSLPLLILLAVLTSYCQHSPNNTLIKVHTGEYDEPGVASGYVNMDGDTLIPIGKYQYCYTDTLKHFAIVLKKNGQLIAIDQSDRQLFEVFRFDNGPDYVKEGLFRIIKDGKIGYANQKGEVVIKPQFDCAFPFKNGQAKVSNNCTSIDEGEHNRWESNEWFFIDHNGKQIK